MAKKSRTASTTEPALTGAELADFYKALCKEFPIFSIEDGFDEVGGHSTWKNRKKCKELQKKSPLLLCLFCPPSTLFPRPPPPAPTPQPQASHMLSQNSVSFNIAKHAMYVSSLTIILFVVLLLLQDDWESWTAFTKDVGKDVQIVGDDLTVTNPERIAKAAGMGACNALLLKVNQIGSVTESIAAVKLAKQSGWGIMTSHRSGETEDNYIADLAVGLCTGQIKVSG